MSSKSLILAALKKKFDGVDEKVLNRIAKNLANTSEVHSEEEATTAIEDVTLQNVIDSYADSRATDATHSAITNYEKKYGLKEGKKSDGTQTTETTDTKADDDGEDAKDVAGKTKTGTIITKGTDSELLALLKKQSDAIESLTGEIKAIKDGKVTESRTSVLKEALKDASDDYRAKVDKLTKHMDLKGMSEEDFNDLVSDFQDGADSAGDGGMATGAQQGGVQGVQQQRNIVGAPKAGGKSTPPIQVNPFVKARAEANEKAVANPAIQGVNTQTQTQ